MILYIFSCDFSFKLEQTELYASTWRTWIRIHRQEFAVSSSSAAYCWVEYGGRRCADVFQMFKGALVSSSGEFLCWMCADGWRTAEFIEISVRATAQQLESRGLNWNMWDWSLYQPPPPPSSTLPPSSTSTAAEEVGLVPRCLLFNSHACACVVFVVSGIWRKSHIVLGHNGCRSKSPQSILLYTSHFVSPLKSIYWCGRVQSSLYNPRTLRHTVVSHSLHVIVSIISC